MDFLGSMGPSVGSDISLHLDNRLPLSLDLSSPQAVARAVAPDPTLPSWLTGSWGSHEGLRIWGLAPSVASGWP